MKYGHKLTQILHQLRRRYSAPAALAFLACVAWSIYSFMPYRYGVEQPLRDALDQAAIACMIGLFPAAAVCSMHSRFRKTTAASWVVGLIVTVLAFLFPGERIWPALVIASALIAIWMLAGKQAPAIRLNQICGWLFVTLGTATVIYFSLFLIASVVFSLFFPKISSVISSGIYAANSCFSFLLIASWMFLGGLSAADSPIDRPDGFRKFNARLLLPFSLALMAVLLMYVGKIIITRTMPVGTMNGFALLSLALFTFFHLTLTGEENKIAGWFTKWCGWLMLPILVTQQIGVYIRIDAYGLTSARVLGMAATLLLAAVVVTSLLRKRASWFFAAGAVLTLVFLASPINAFQIARINQENRLEAALTRNQMLTADGDIVANPDAAVQDKRIIYDTIKYLLFEEAPENSLTHQLQSHFSKGNESPSYDKEIAFQLLGFSKPRIDDNNSFSYSFKGTADHDDLNTHGYSHAKWVNARLLFETEDEAFSAMDENEANSSCYLLGSESILCDSFIQGENGYIFPDTPFMLYIDDDTVDLTRLFSEIVLNTSSSLDNYYSFTCSNDLLPTAAGHVFHLNQLSFQQFHYTNGLSIVLTGWLLTPED